MGLPNISSLPETRDPALPFVLVGDEAFPLKNYLLRPYPGNNLPRMQPVNNQIMLEVFLFQRMR